MSGIPTVALAASAALLIAAGPAAARLAEPVSVTSTAPDVVAANSPFALRVDVAADAGALDIAAQPLRLKVRLEPECGASFAGTEGPTVIDRVLPAPVPGAPYSAGATTRVKLGAVGTETVCAFLEDAQERQFATDTEATITVTAGCTVATRDLSRLRRRLDRLEGRLAHLRRQKRQARGRQRQALARRGRALRKRHHAVVVQKRRARHRANAACQAGEGR